MESILASELDDLFNDDEFDDITEDEYKEYKEDNNYNKYSLNKAFLNIDVVEQHNEISISILLEPENHNDVDGFKYNNTLVYIVIAEEDNLVEISICNKIAEKIISEFNDTVHINIKDLYNNDVLFDFNPVFFDDEWESHELYYGGRMIVTSYMYDEITNLYYNYNKLLENNNNLVNITIN